MKFEDIKYLSFEGGGGKGIVYLGAIKVLEKRLQQNYVIDIKAPLDNDQKRKIKGVSGASAGAITAFLLSMGMSSKEIETEIREFRKKTYKEEPNHGDDGINGRYAIVVNNGKSIYHLSKINSAEGFLDSPTGFNRTIERNGRRTYSYETVKEFLNVENYLVDPIKELFINSDGIIDNPVIQKLFYPITDTGQKITHPSFTGAYVNNLFFHRGGFTGLKVRYFLQYLIKKYLIDKYSEYQKENYGYSFPKPENITFYDFYKFTGVDLVISGVNISQHRSLYFSVYHTPDFPVIEAVAISMNIPIVFKPIYIDYDVDKNRDRNYNLFYKGLWGDGGMLNNLPVHAFNLFKSKKVEFQGHKTNRDLAANLYNSDSKFSKRTLGFMLGDNISNDKPKLISKYKDIYTADPSGNLMSYLGDLFNTFMFPGSAGRIRNVEEAEYVIELDSTGVDTLDFAHPDQDEARARVLKSWLPNFKGDIAKKGDIKYQVSELIKKFEKRALDKKQRILDAITLVDKRI